MKFRSALLAASMLALPGVANAQMFTPNTLAINGLYVGAGVGYNYLDDEKVKGGTASSSFGSGDLRSHGGFVGLGSVGYGFGNGLRAEIEGSYRNNQFRQLRGGTAASASGREQKYGPMANVLYDFYGLVPYVTPYVGVGVGYQFSQWDGVRATASGASAAYGNKTEGAFAYQGIAGAAFSVTPNLAITAEYRFLGMTGDRKYGGTVTTGGTTTNANFKANDEYNHAGLIGLRYAFGAVGPMMATAAAAAPAPAPARSYLVFFDWDKSNLTDRARQIIADAAANSKKVSYTKIETNGYTDSSGTAKYNQGLSVRRAQVVAAELVKDGVPKNAIAITGFGETNPLVPTGPNVREPQNRRVEIVIK